MYSFLPLSLVPTTITPVHLTETMSHIFRICTFVYISTWPAEYPIALFFILPVLTLVLISISCSFFPHTMTIPHPHLEITFKITSIRPEILSIPMRLAIHVLTFIQITICKLLSAFSLFQTLFKIPLIPIPINPNMNTISISFTHPPLPYITIPLGSLPHPTPMFQSVNPFSLIKLTIRPTIFTYSLWFAINIHTCIYTSVWKLLVPFSLLVITLPGALIDALVVIYHYA